jgi:leader peptidase (prepilin peptidase)/N-methyltransferase
MDAFSIATFALLGVAVGSFLNVVIDRLPDNMSIISPPSRCSACKKRLSARDLIPVLSYLKLRGRCRYCKAAISGRTLWVEISGGAAFSLLYWHYGLSVELTATALYFCMFLVILVIDLEKLIVMPVIVIFGLVAAIAFSIFIAESPLVPDLTDAAIGGATGLGIFLVIYLVAFVIYRGNGFGLGDVYIGVLMGFVLGFPNVIVGILLSFLIGGITAVFLVALKLRGMKQVVPLGVFLSLGTMVTLLWGTNILDWYLGYF